jgi:hypothetical protein
VIGCFCSNSKETKHEKNVAFVQIQIHNFDFPPHSTRFHNSFNASFFSSPLLTRIAVQPSFTAALQFDLHTPKISQIKQ